MKDMTRIVRQIAPGPSFTRVPRIGPIQAAPCGQRCPARPEPPGESSKHRRCMLGPNGCAHALFK